LLAEIRDLLVSIDRKLTPPTTMLTVSGDVTSKKADRLRDYLKRVGRLDKRPAQP
jgi:hypothetical protein